MNKIEKDINTQYFKIIETIKNNKVYPKIYKGEYSKITITVIFRDFSTKTEKIKLIATVDNKEYDLPTININR